MTSAIHDIDAQGLRGYLNFVETTYPEELLRISQPVSPKVELTAALFELERVGRNPVVIFENVVGHDMPVVTNISANRKMIAASLGVSSAELPLAYRERCLDYKPVETVDSPPWKEVVIEGDDLDLYKLPIPWHFEIDGAPYITAGQITARDPESGVDTTGFHRLMLKDRNRLGVSLHSRRRMYEYHRRAEARGEALPAAVTLGIHPLHHMGSMAYHYPPGVRKYEIIGGLLGTPYRVARCGTADLEVPASSEIVIEGEILAAEHEPEGPFSEFTGYASYRSTQNVFVAKRISMRSDAMFHSIVGGMSSDHILIGSITREGEILNTLKRNFPNVIAVHVPRITCGGLMAVISMKKTLSGQPHQAIMAAMGTEYYAKIVVVVDEDVDIYDLSDVMWAVATRVRAEKDVVLVPGAMGAVLDPSADPENFSVTKVGIDATKPEGRDFAERLSISETHREKARVLLEEAGIRI